MKNKRKSETKLNKNVSIFIKTQILELLLYVVFLLIASCVAYRISINSNSYLYISVSLLSVAAVIGGYYSGRKMRKNGLLIGFLFCLPLNIIAHLISMILNNFNIDLTVLISFSILSICSMLGGILSVNAKTKPNKRK